MNIKDIICNICTSSYEATPDSETLVTIKEAMAPICEDIRTDALGNLICTVKAKGKKHIALSAHMDKIGFKVTNIDKNTGLLSIARAGSPDLRTLCASRVKVMGKKTLYGCVTSTPPHLMKGDKSKVTPIDEVYVDCGLGFEEISEIVSVGDTVLYHSPVKNLLGDRLSGAYMDNSTGCAAVIRACQLLYDSDTQNRITAVFTTREETGKGGALAAFTELAPDFALITDVSHGSAPGIPEEKSAPLSSGAMICHSPIISKEVSSFIKNTAEKNNIPFTLAVEGARTATDTDVAVSAGKGIKAGLISIPLLYMHTPVETASLSDIQSVASLLYCCAKEGI